MRWINEALRSQATRWAGLALALAVVFGTANLAQADHRHRGGYGGQDPYDTQVYFSHEGEFGIGSGPRDDCDHHHRRGPNLGSGYRFGGPSFGGSGYGYGGLGSNYGGYNGYGYGSSSYYQGLPFYSLPQLPFGYGRPVLPYVHPGMWMQFGW